MYTDMPLTKALPPPWLRRISSISKPYLSRIKAVHPTSFAV